MSREQAVVTLALTASFLFALSAYLQQRVGRSVPGGRTSAASGLGAAVVLTGRLVREPRWVLGWLVNVAGFLLQAVALRLGSVTAVQPLMPTQLLFALVLADWHARRLPTLRDWLAGAAVCAGVVLLLRSEAAHLGGPADRHRVLLAAAGVAVVVAVAVLAARGRTPRVAAAVIACGAGACFAMSAVLLKLTADVLAGQGVGAAVDDWPLYGLACTTTVGLVLGQAALAAGPLPWAVAVTNTVNPLLGYAVGCFAFHAPVPGDARSWGTLVVAAALLAAGVVGLVTSASQHAWTRERPHANVNAG